jgi:alkanesulfonate monooxygenase SsuD/methylene tetrahydromethanopterin reductase-like flavin-dependent oxidoreductase (luciferase family)
MFLREHEYASEMGFDGSVCNEHHNNVLSMQESVNISAAVISQRIKGTIALIGNPLPIHDNPVRVAEEIAMLDLISGGRIISGFVRHRHRAALHQRQSRLQPRALRRGLRAHQEDLDRSRPLPLGGQALSPARRQSMAIASAEAAPADLGGRYPEPGDHPLGGAAAHHLSGLGQCPRGHRHVPRHLPRGRARGWVAADATAPRLPDPYLRDGYG